MEKSEILKMLMDNAEDPVIIKDGTGTFVTFRVEYLINDIKEKLDEAFRQGQIAQLKEDIEENRLVRFESGNRHQVIFTADLVAKLKVLMEDK
jgi:hypothetical protein